MPMKSRLFISSVLFISVSSVTSSSMVFDGRIFYHAWSICTLDTLLGRHVFTSCTVNTGHDWKYNFWFALIYVDLTGLNAAAWSYLIKSVWFAIWYALLIPCYISLSKCGLFFIKVLPIIQYLCPLLQSRDFFLPLWCGRLLVWKLHCTLHHTFWRWIAITCVVVLIGYGLLFLLGGVVVMSMYIL